MPISIEIVGRQGRVFAESGLDKVVVRRREERTPGAEMAFLPGHAPLLAQTEACRLRMTRHGVMRTLDVGGGVLEVLDDRVTIVLV